MHSPMEDASMKVIVSLLILGSALCLAAGCDLGTQDPASLADRVTVDFNCGDGGERPARLVLTRGDQIARAAAALSGQPAPFYKCGYTGSMSFYRSGKPVLEEIGFNLHAECRHAMYMKGKTAVSRQLTDDGMVFLAGLKKWACGEQ